MAPHKKKSIHFGPSHSGKKPGNKGKVHKKKRAKTTSNAGRASESSDVASKFEDPSMQASPWESESEGEKKEDFHHESSRPGSQAETLSSGIRLAHARKRSHSLPSQIVGDRTSAGEGTLNGKLPISTYVVLYSLLAPWPPSLSTTPELHSVNTLQAHNARTQAISLIRARTLSRSSDCGQLSPEFLQILLQNYSTSEGVPVPAAEGPPGSMDFMKASLMDFVKKPKKNKSKGKKQSGNAEAVQVPVEQTGGSSNAPEKGNTDHVPVEQIDKFSESSQKDSTGLVPAKQTGESSEAPQQDNNDHVLVEETGESSKASEKESTENNVLTEPTGESSEAPQDNNDHVLLEETGDSSKASEKESTENNVPTEQTGECSEAPQQDNTEHVLTEENGKSSKASEKEDTENNVPTEQIGESSKTPVMGSTLELPIREKGTSTNPGPDAEGQSIKTQPSDDTDNGKDKQRVAVLDEASNEDVALHLVQSSDDTDKENVKQPVEVLDEAANKDAALPSSQPLDDIDKCKGKQRVKPLETEALKSDPAIPSTEPSPVESEDSWTIIIEKPKSPELDRAKGSSTAPVKKESYADKVMNKSPKSSEMSGVKDAKPATSPVQKKTGGVDGKDTAKAPKTLESTGSKDVKSSISPMQKKADGGNGKAAVEAPKTPESTGSKDSRPSVPSSQKSSAKPASSKKKQLPTIKEGQAQNDTVTSEYPFIVSSTPKSTSPASTSNVWTPSVPASTPQTATATSAPSTGDSPKNKGKGKGKGKNKNRNKNKGKGKVASTTEAVCPARPPAPSPSSTKSTSGPLIVSSHAHPSPSTVTTSSAVTNNAIQHNGRQMVTQKPAGWYWNLDIHCFPCAKEGCNLKCNLWDDVSRICPKCGPFSTLRYCSREHLLQDVKKHWERCGTYTFEHPCKESTVADSIRLGPPLIPCLYGYDMLERHRQAVHFNMNHRKGDYFIFSDWADMVRKNLHEKPDSDERKTKVRCSSDIIHVVKFDDPEERDRFRRVLAAVLFVTIENPMLTDYLYRMIRDNIRATTTDFTNPPPNPLLSLEASLEYQMYREFNTTIQPYITGRRHACPTDWTGRNRRSCTDDVCWKEYEEQYKLGQRAHGGHKMAIEELEASYWILRMARITHPTVEHPMERMWGKGFRVEDGHFGVDERDMRKFRRGPGWDGFDTGEMQIEGVNY
ncbi:uncharacterized protein DSM5745_10938 [Aspergillus mulundensis]|uniref:Uncharacterized protein n=1 Tax=Aspergillus mulundensis TaxID=1810919 RepID=A0A3D8QFN9_9EURO|nr:hypothetical protein DSM5745_10938 [Aspergillus mulundensis]RDW60480.1 hypothetical protein DSM5745_10938 [Aspergillus mulundensis]